MGESVEIKEKTKDEVDATKADASEEAGNGQKYKKMWKVRTSDSRALPRDLPRADASPPLSSPIPLDALQTAGQAAMFTARVASFNWKSVRSVPFKRRVQTFWVLTWLSGIAVLPMFTMILTVFLVVATPFSPFAVSETPSPLSLPPSLHLSPESAPLTSVPSSLVLRLVTSPGFSSSTSPRPPGRGRGRSAVSSPGGTCGTTFP